MSIDQYIKAAIRTERIPSFEITFPEHVFRLVDPNAGEVIVRVPARKSQQGGILGTIQARLLHSALGMSTEIGELLAGIAQDDKVNIAEELGDIMWYWAVGMDALDLHELPATSPLRGLDLAVVKTGAPLVQAICVWADLVRRHVIHGKDLRVEDAGHALLDVYRQASLVAIGGGDIYSVMEANINKLRIRFPEKYDAERFGNRDLEAERASLEKDTSAVMDSMTLHCTCLYDMGSDTKTFTDGCPIHAGGDVAEVERAPACRCIGLPAAPGIPGTCPAHPDR